MPTKKEVLYLSAGIGIGIGSTRVVPNLRWVKYSKFGVEVIKARFRLQKILIKEYERIDDAIAAEQIFLDMIAPKIKNRTFFVKFTVDDDGLDRNINTEVKLTPKKNVE